MEETLRTHLIELFRLFEEATGTTPTTVGKRALNDNTFFNRLREADASFTLRTYDRLVQWMAAHWPDGAVWPEEVQRPDPEITGAAA